MMAPNSGSANNGGSATSALRIDPDPPRQGETCSVSFTGDSITVNIEGCLIVEAVSTESPAEVSFFVPPGTAGKTIEFELDQHSIERHLAV
jgi:hypothetical protein